MRASWRTPIAFAALIEAAGRFGGDESWTRDTTSLMKNWILKEPLPEVGAR